MNSANVIVSLLSVILLSFSTPDAIDIFITKHLENRKKRNLKNKNQHCIRFYCK
jgi:hypothetical protein